MPRPQVNQAISVRRGNNIMVDHGYRNWSIDQGLNVWRDVTRVAVPWCADANSDGCTKLEEFLHATNPHG
jgi:hypothetical protein